MFCFFHCVFLRGCYHGQGRAGFWLFFVHSRSSYTIRHSWLVTHQTPARLRPPPRPFPLSHTFPLSLCQGKYFPSFQPQETLWATDELTGSLELHVGHSEWTLSTPETCRTSSCGMAKQSSCWFSVLRTDILLKVIYFSGWFSQPDRSGLDRPLADLSAGVTLVRQHSDEASKLWEELNKSSGGFEGAASEPSTPAESQTGSVRSESGKPHLFAPLRPSPPAPSEEKSLFLRSEQRSHKCFLFFFYVFYFFTTFAQHRFSLKSVTQIPALSGETRKVKGSQSLGKDRHTLERPSLVGYVYTSGNIPRKRRNGCNSLSPCSGNLLFSLTERSISSFVLTSFSRYRSWYEPYDSLWNTLRQPHQ